MRSAGPKATSHLTSTALTWLGSRSTPAPTERQQTLHSCGIRGSGDHDTHFELLLEYGLGKGKGRPWRARLEKLTLAQLLKEELVWAEAQIARSSQGS